MNNEMHDGDLSCDPCTSKVFGLSVCVIELSLEAKPDECFPHD